MRSTPSATEPNGLATRHIAEQQERIAQQRTVLAGLDAAGNTASAAQARRRLDEMCERLALMHRQEREAKQREPERKAEEAEVAHMADVMRDCPL